MSGDDSSLRAGGRSWLRIVGVLLLIGLVGGAGYWFLRPREVTATALFEVRNEAPSFVNGTTPLSKNDFDIHKKDAARLSEK